MSLGQKRHRMRVGLPIVEANKGKGLPRTGHEGPEGEQMYIFTLPSTSALDGGGLSTPRPSRLAPGKDPLYRRLGGPQDRSGRVRKISSPHQDHMYTPSPCFPPFFKVFLL